MKKLMTFVLALAGLMSVFSRDVVAEVRFVSFNHAVRGGRVQVEGPGGKCVSAEFRQSNELVSGRRVWNAILPCNIADGGIVRVGMNGKPKTFHLPAGIVVHGREVGVAMEIRSDSEPLFPVIYPINFGLDFDPESTDRFYISFGSKPGGVKCRVIAHLSWPENVPDYDAYMVYRNDRVQKFLTHYALPCQD